MWNEQTTDKNLGMTARLIRIKGYQNQSIHAYTARPNGRGPYPGMVLIHHAPGWDEFYREMTRRFAEHGFVAICPDLYDRFGHGSSADVAAKARADGGVADDSVVGDCKAAMEHLKAQSYCNGKVGIIGTCSGGRQAFLTACRAPGFSALVDCWGGGVVTTPDRLTPKQPVAPVDYTKDLPCPVLGIFGNDDQGPSPDQVNQLEAELKKQGKRYEFHRYDGAGHGFWYYDRPNYRQEQAMDSLNKTLDFLKKQLA